ncbi:hypothetical protein JTE90_002699 [Oedothorax gibbosus]|uniref:Uncharacterized protein n=1 Tax=Oedothorax gibbosus TaxID=931172 RepID=A0AAV6VY31_9ARAC|nr:hypothetical protein JTE90_002699 [Oedothorax gibbosus]
MRRNFETQRTLTQTSTLHKQPPNPFADKTGLTLLSLMLSILPRSEDADQSTCGIITIPTVPPDWSRILLKESAAQNILGSCCFQKLPPPCAVF